MPAAISGIPGPGSGMRITPVTISVPPAMHFMRKMNKLVGDFTSSKSALIGSTRGRQVYLVNVRVPRDWEDDVNASLRACAASYARVHYLNWWKKSARHLDGWIADGGYHLTAEGQDGYAAWIDDRVDAVVRALRAAG